MISRNRVTFHRHKTRTLLMRVCVCVSRLRAFNRHFICIILTLRVAEHFPYLRSDDRVLIRVLFNFSLLRGNVQGLY